ncbi:MAG TPA: LamG-like jellyroll fold domain-containing protein, partial [Candidatus Acidoferrum sp.]|nr:LamG-like jellyroll fold domain-containing protein [Candidatus Acidoferrum sp.]
EGSGVAVLYINGQAQAQQNPGSYTARTLGDFYLGVRPYDGGAGTRFVGLMDEVSLYNRALSATEIQQIYLAGALGKCPPAPPAIVSQPASQGAVEGGSVSFMVVATGAQPMTYQWTLNGTPIPGATRAAYNLSSAQTTNAGAYAVTVQNSLGAAQSADATLALIPAAWAIEYFGADYQNEPFAAPDADADGDGVTNLQEYQQGSDPNKIRFSVQFDSLYVQDYPATATFDVVAGHPAQMAVLVDNTNLDLAAWVPYTPSVSVPLGSLEGPHAVWIGLKGFASASVQTWEGFRLVRDTTPPVIVITSPLASTVTRPVLQLQGYSLEPLSSLSYDLANDAGTVSNLEGYLERQCFDTNLLDFTTNWFECLDIPLTNGVNTITLYATDLAGNVSTSTHTYTLDYSGVTSGPVLTLYWPPNGALVSGSSFTLRGMLDDPTATVTAQITDAGGASTQAQGLVERNGLLWVENLPLSAGANTLTLTMTNVAGLWTSTSLTVTQSDVLLTIDDLSGVDLNQPSITVNGTIGAEGYTVWVNGVEANPNGDGSWSAIGVPVNDGGTAVIQARAIPETDNGGQGTGGSGGTASTMANPGNPSSVQAVDVEAAPDKAPVVLQVHYDKALIDDWQGTPASPGVVIETDAIGWDLGSSGMRFVDHCTGGLDRWYYMFTDYQWNSHGIGTKGHGLTPTCGDRTYSWIENYAAPTDWGGEFCEVSAERDDCAGPVIIDHLTRSRIAHSRYILRTGGKRTQARMNIFQVAASSQSIANPFWPEADSIAGASAIPPTSISAGIFGFLDGTGNAYKQLYDGMSVDVTPTVKGNPYYIFEAPIVSKYHSYFTVFVIMPSPPPTMKLHDGKNWGHAWWLLSSEAPPSVVNHFCPFDCTSLLGQPVGYAASGWPNPGKLPWLGYLRVPDDAANPTVTRRSEISSDCLINALVYTKAVQDSHEYYDFFGNNCATKAYDAGCEAGVVLPFSPFPELFGWYILQMPPP